MTAFGYILTVFVVTVMIKMYLESDAFNLKCIVSEVDGNRYCVRERMKLQLAADLLARVTGKLKRTVAGLAAKYPDQERVQRLRDGFNPKKVCEILPSSSYTAYSENKGEKLAFCTTTTKEGDALSDENTLTFVGLHEISHIMTKSVGHTDEFWKNFKFVLAHAAKAGLYRPEDYKKKHKDYCGMQITDNPYYDL